MKKFSILIAILLCVTIGGVYAAWMFADSTDAALKTQTVTLGLTTDVEAGAYGVYTLTPSTETDPEGAFGLVVDDIDDGTIHNAVLVGKGYLTVTFTPNESATEAVRTGAVPTYWCLKTGDSIDNWLYDGNKIFNTIDGAWKTIDGVNASNWVASADGKSFTYTISGETIANMIDMNDFTLETKTEYNAFASALQFTKITLYVNDSQTTE